MAVNVSWFDPNRRILQYCFIGKWNWDEYFVALAAGRDLQKQADWMTCTLNNLSQTQHLPDDFIEMARSVSQTRPVNTGIAVYISTDYHFRAIYDILCRLDPDQVPRYPLAATLDEALAKINRWFEQQDARTG